MKTLREVCKLTGVSRRTLQEYAKKDIDLLQPTSKTGPGGYWMYDDTAILKLSIIQIFVEAGYKRKDIKKRFEDPAFDLVGEFDSLIYTLEEKKAQLEGKLFLLKKFKKMGDIISAFRKELNVEAFQRQAKKIIETGSSDYFNIPAAFSSYTDLFVAFQQENLTETEKEELTSFFDFTTNIFVIASLSYKPPHSKIIQSYVKEAYENLSRFILLLCTEENFTDDSTKEDMQQQIDAIKNNDPEYIKEFQTGALDFLDEETKEALLSQFGKDILSYLKDAFLAFTPDNTYLTDNCCTENT